MAIRGIGQPDDSPVSKSAMLLATACAVVSKDPVYSRSFVDPYAGLFAAAISDEAAATLATLDDRAAREAFIAEWEKDLAGLITHVVYRKPWIAERVRAAIDAGAGQLVILGAGCDSLALRLGEALAGVAVFEVDRPSVLEFRRRVIAAEMTWPANVRLVPVDIENEDLAQALLAASYDPGQAAAFVAEGMMEYLTTAEVDRLFAFVHAHGPAGTRFIFTFLASSLYEDDALDELREELKAGGEALKFGIAPERLDEFLAARGFRKLDLATPEWVQTVLVPRIGAPVGVIPGWHLVVAESVAG